MKAVEVEIGGPLNECLSFRPLPGRLVRGRYDLNRVAEPLAKLKSAEWPVPVPGQRIGVDAEGIGYLAEPLHSPEHKPLREKIERAGMRLEPELTTFEGVDVVSWLYWLKRAVEGGIARVVKGALPDKIDGKPRKNFIMAEPEPSAVDKLTAAIEKQSQLFERLLEKLSK